MTEESEQSQARSTDKFISDYNSRLKKERDLSLFGTEISNKTDSNDIYITETNWPLKNTGRYSPTSNQEAVNTNEYANYMVRYYLISIASTHIKKLYWHQLVAIGYGLVDTRNGIKKRVSFKAFKFMNKVLKDMTFYRYDIKQNLHSCSFVNNDKKIIAMWAESRYMHKIEDNNTFLMCSKKLNNITIDLSKVVIFKIFNKEQDGRTN